jgi:hypothetical protein
MIFAEIWNQNWESQVKRFVNLKLNAFLANSVKHIGMIGTIGRNHSLFTRRHYPQLAGIKRGSFSEKIGNTLANDKKRDTLLN